MIALLDADFLLYRVGFASEEDDEGLAVRRLVDYFTDIVFFDANCDSYVAYISGANNFRYDIATTVPYKGNRKAPKPKHYQALRERLKKLGCIESEGEEADDRIAIEAYSRDVDSYTIIKVDKDLDQIRGTHYNPITKVFKSITEDDALKNFYLQLLQGDRTDNIPGLEGIGPKKALKALADCTTEAELYAKVLEVYSEHNKSLDYLIEQARLLWLRREPGQMWNPPIESKPNEDT